MVRVTFLLFPESIDRLNFYLYYPVMTRSVELDEVSQFSSRELRLLTRKKRETQKFLVSSAAGALCFLFALEEKNVSRKSLFAMAGIAGLLNGAFQGLLQHETQVEIGRNEEKFLHEKLKNVL